MIAAEEGAQVSTGAQGTLARWKHAAAAEGEILTNTVIMSVSGKWRGKLFDGPALSGGN